MPKRAVVLAGGGARGPYQIGVWQALRELGIDYQIVCGSSVGALNGALMVQGDYEAARDMWLSLTKKDVVVMPEEMDITSLAGRQALADYVRSILARGGLDISPMEALVRRVVDEERLRASPVEFGLITVRLPTLRPVRLTKEEIPQGMLVDYLLASATYFPFFNPRRIDGHHYIDGAYWDNIPAQIALRCGAQELITVDLAGRGIVHRMRENIPHVYIRSYWHLGEILDFNTENARRDHLLGYHDTLKAYRRLEGCAYAIAPGETARNAARLRPVMADIRRESGVSLFRDYQRIPKIQEALRYRDHRFVKYSAQRHTFGAAVTAAAEIAAELLGVEPDRIWCFEELNAQLRRRSAFLFTPVRRLPDGDSVPQRLQRAYAQALTHQIFSMLLDACGSGRLPSAFWGLVTIGPREFIAAYYLLALFQESKRK